MQKMATLSWKLDSDGKKWFMSQQPKTNTNLEHPNQEEEEK